MTPSVELPLADVRGVFALISQVCELWADPAAWRARLLQGMCDLTNSSVGSVTGQTLNSDLTFGDPVRLAVVGLSLEVQKAIFDRSIDQSRKAELEEVNEIAPGFGEVFTRFANQGWATVRRGEVCTDEAYHASATYRNFRAPADCDDYIISVRKVDRPSHVEINYPGSSAWRHPLFTAGSDADYFIA